MRWIIALSLLLLNVIPATADTLKGGVQHDEEVINAKLQELRPKWDASGLKEQCLCINPNRAQVKEVNGQWMLLDELSPIAEFGSRKDAAIAALDVVKHYGFTESCWAGRTQGGSLSEMRYFKTPEGAPVGALPGEDAITIDPAAIKAEQIGGRWKVTSGDIWVLDFDQDQQAAEQARDIIQVYGFTKHCFVGNPARAMMYFRK